MAGEREASLAAAGKLGLTPMLLQVRDEAELDAALARAQRARTEGLEMFPDNSTMRYSERVAEFTRAQRVPAISGWAEFVERGNMLSYGPDVVEAFARLASHANRVFKGARPADLPIELPTRFELAVNMKAAAEIGIKIPPTILARADRVIS